MRAMWRGEISFGLVMIPIRLYAATEHRDVSFRQVHAKDGARVRMRRFIPNMWVGWGYGKSCG